MLSPTAAAQRVLDEVDQTRQRLLFAAEAIVAHLKAGDMSTKLVAVQHVEDRLLLLGAQGTRLPPLAVRDRRRSGRSWRRPRLGVRSFACTSTTKRALASSCSNWRFSASRRAIFSACGSRRLRPRGTANPASAPASRALRHSTIWLEYTPSRRNNAAFAPSGAASYSAKISNLYLAVNVRRFSFSAPRDRDVPFQRHPPAQGLRPRAPEAMWSPC